MLLRWSLLSAMVMAWMPLPGAWAHEIRPAYLEINEITPGRYDVLWRTPVLSGRQLPIVLKFAEGTRNVTEPSLRELPDSLLERRVIELPGGLAGTRIDIVGLQATITDVLVRAQMLNGTHSTTLVHPSQPWLEIAAERGWLSVVGAYLRHGIDHILLGYDHLLFVFALMLIVRRTQALLWTITAFTLAHSITLALSALDIVVLPPWLAKCVEPAIAASIVFVGVENILRRGAEPRGRWLLTFAFGLIHGFGFASVLRDLGLGTGGQGIAMPLLTFNLGVELGQIAIAAVVLPLLWRLRRNEKFVARGVPAISAVVALAGLWWLLDRTVF